MFKPTKLAKGRKENTVVNYKGEQVEFMKQNGARYFENTHTKEAFSDRVTPDLFSRIGAILFAATNTPIILSGYYEGETAPRGTTRANETLQKDIESACNSANVPFDYIVNLFKSFTASIAGEPIPFDPVAERKAAREAYESKIAMFDVFKDNPAYDAMIEAPKALYELELKRINTREKASISQKARHASNKAESDEVESATQPA